MRVECAIGDSGGPIFSYNVNHWIQVSRYTKRSILVNTSRRLLLGGCHCSPARVQRTEQYRYVHAVSSILWLDTRGHGKSATTHAWTGCNHRNNEGGYSVPYYWINNEDYSTHYHCFCYDTRATHRSYPRFRSSGSTR